MNTESWNRVNDLVETFRHYGYMRGPCIYGPEEGKSSGGKNIILFGFSIPRLLDGELNYFNRRFLTIRYQRGRKLYTESFRSIEEVEQWVKDNGWAGNIPVSENGESNNENSLYI